jgi:cysteine-rich repeat protein
MTMKSRSLVWLVVAGCGPSVAVSDDGALDGGSTDAGASSDADDADDDGISAEAGDDADDTGALPACGDGVVDAGEACDDGDAASGNGCNPDCRVSGALLWSAIVESEVGGSAYLPHVAIAPAGVVLAAALQIDDVGVQYAELNAFDLDGVSSWQTLSAVTAESEQLFGLVVGSAPVASMLTAVVLDGVQSSFISNYGLDGAVLGGLFTGTSESYPTSLAIDGGNVLGSVGSDVASGWSGWVEAQFQTGGDVWFATSVQPAWGIEGLAAGGFYVARNSPQVGAMQIERLDPSGALLWTTLAACSGALAVAGDDTLVIVGVEGPNLAVCRVAGDGSSLASVAIDVGGRQPTALAATAVGDLVVGGYTTPETRPWLARIGADGVVQWSYEPAVGSSEGGFVQSVAVDESLGLVVAGVVATTGIGSSAQLQALTP